MKLTGKMQKAIIEDREKAQALENKYTDDKIKRMLKYRFDKLKSHESTDIWVENGVFFIEDDSMMGFSRYTASDNRSKRYVDEILFLVIILESF